MVQLGNDARHDACPLVAQKVAPGDNAGTRVGVELGKRQILELVLHLMHAEPLGEWRVDVHRFARDPPALLVVLDEPQGLHVVQPVGQFDEQDPNVFGHGEDELAEILGLLRLVRLQLDPRQLGHAVDEPPDFRPEPALDIVEGRDRILDRVVQ
jgi:hypothetical protein